MDEEQCAYRPQGHKCENRTNGLPVGSLEKTFQDYGKATLVFENCNDPMGTIQIFKNTYLVRDVSPYRFNDKVRYSVEIFYKPGDVLEIKENNGAIIKISSLTLARRKYFLSIRTINLIEISFPIFLEQSL